MSPFPFSGKRSDPGHVRTRQWFALWMLIAALPAAEARQAETPAGQVRFSQKPTATAGGGKEIKISFALAAAADVEVGILSADGKVVRHLAAGVLGGASPPPEPLHAGLLQEISWDGKDDLGKPAAGGPFQVRVRAGMGIKLGRFIGGDPYFDGGSNGLVTGDDGNLYLLGAGTALFGDERSTTLRVFTPEGRYLKTLMPFPADLAPGSMKDVARWDEVARSWRPRNKYDLIAEFYRTSGFRNSLYTSNIQLLSASRKNGILLVVPGSGAVYRLDLQGAVPGQTLLAGVPGLPPEVERALRGHTGPECYCVSADGKYLYHCGPYPPAKQATPKVPPGTVWRVKLDGSEPTMSPFVVLPSTPDGPWTRNGGKTYGAFGPVHGVSTDSHGNVYVCDREKSRVAVFNEGGTEIGGISVKNPDLVAVHPKTGAIYVIRRASAGGMDQPMILDKFAGFAQGAVAIASFNNFHSHNFPRLAITVDENRTRIWLSGATYADKPRLDDTRIPIGLMSLEDKGDSFQAVELPRGPAPDGPDGFARISTDPVREEIYVSNDPWECIRTNGMIFRYNGDTGEGAILQKDGKIFYAEDLSVGYDGLLYVKSGPKMSGPFERMTRDLVPVPFSAIGTQNLTDVYVRCGEKGVGVGPEGKVYTCAMYAEGRFFVSGWNSDGLPLEGKYLTGKIEQGSHMIFFQRKLPDHRRTRSALIGPFVNHNVAGIRVDLKGNFYLGLAMLPKGYSAPAAMENFAKITGSVVKFRPEGGAVLGYPDSESKDPDAPRLETGDKRFTIEGGLVMYPGLAPFSGRVNGSSACCCRGPRFDVDRYGRLALPTAVSNSVTLMDNAGNKILEFGKYGNFDSQYVPPDSKDGKPLVTTPDIPMGWPTGAGFTEKAVYVTDTYNRRLIRADMTWKAEESCAIR